MTPADTYREIVAKIRAGRPIEATTFARDQFAITLLEAKRLVEAISESIVPFGRLPSVRTVTAYGTPEPALPVPSLKGE